jgi:hypothetical protein
MGNEYDTFLVSFQTNDLPREDLQSINIESGIDLIEENVVRIE